MYQIIISPLKTHLEMNNWILEIKSIVKAIFLWESLTKETPDFKIAGL